MDNKILAFWNERAGLGDLAGTNDFILTRIEQKYLLSVIPENSFVLDMGCGNGGSLIRLVTERGCSGHGLDFSPKMVETASAAVAERGLGERIKIGQHMLPGMPQGIGPFDLVYTQRCLINLETVEQQREAVLGMQKLLKPGGMYVMLECSLDGGERTNAVRADLSLPPVNPPWHNLFFKEEEVASWSTQAFRLERLDHVSSTYHFLSRVVYAKLAADKGEELKYDSDINLLAERLPPMIGEFGPVKAWIWRKAT